MTKQEAIICSAYTGVLFDIDIADMFNYIESKMCRPIMTHEYPTLIEEIKEATKADFLSIEIK